MWVHEELGEGRRCPRKSWSWTVGSPRVRSRMKCQMLGDLILGMWGISGEVRRMLHVTYWEENSLHLQLQAGNDEMMMIRVQLVGRIQYEASWNETAGQLPMPYEISIYGFIRASERCAELRDVLDGMKMEMQFSSFCFCLLLLLVSVPPYWTLHFCWSRGKHHFPDTYQHISLSRFPPASLKISFMLWSPKVAHLTPRWQRLQEQFHIAHKIPSKPEIVFFMWVARQLLSWVTWVEECIYTRSYCYSRNYWQESSDWHPLACYYGPCINGVEAMTATAFLINKVWCE